MNDVFWTEAALANLRAIRAYIEQFNPAAAARVADAPVAAGTSLASHSHRGRPVPTTRMREIVTAYPYIIRYRVTGTTVVILRIRHTARRPTKP